MSRTIFYKAIAACLFIWISTGLFAQTKPVRNPVKKPAETVPKTPDILPDTIPVPKFTVRFGPFNGKNPVLVDDFKKLLNTKLIITDQRGQAWEPLNFRFGWLQKEESDDWKTGKKKTISNFNAVLVDSSANLPVTWQREMADKIKSGEILSFEKIIIEHPGSKRKMLAPDLLLKLL